MKGRKLKKKPVIVLVCSIILLIVLIIFIVKTVNELNYRKTIEYKLLQQGYNKEEVSLLQKKTDEDFMNSLLEEEYDRVYIDIITEGYYIKNKLKDYVKYYNDHLNASSNEVVTIVNAGANEEWYSHIKDTDLSKDILMINNKFYKLPSDYEPEDLVDVKNWYAYGTNVKLRDEAYNAFIDMFNAAKEEGITLIINSAYRSYKEQEEVYNQYLKNHGQAYTDGVAARPGHSEHQTGLSVDITTYGVTGSQFESTDAFSWLQNNAHNFGFILRYPNEKENITGYTYESWHYRYVGVDAATIIHDSNITFDEYYAYYIENN